MSLSRAANPELLFAAGAVEWKGVAHSKTTTRLPIGTGYTTQSTSYPGEGPKCICLRVANEKSRPRQERLSGEKGGRCDRGKVNSGLAYDQGHQSQAWTKYNYRLALDLLCPTGSQRESFRFRLDLPRDGEKGI